jgi:hypothetical protein
VNCYASFFAIAGMLLWKMQKKKGELKEHPKESNEETNGGT